MKNFWIDGRTVVITGATSGIGRGLTKKFIEDHGSRVIGIGRSEEKFRTLKAELKDKADMLTDVVMDVTDEDGWRALAKKLSEDGVRVDCLINCAGILPPFKRVTYMTPDEIKRAMSVDFFACTYAINALYPTISTSATPAIINVSSAAALCTIVGTGAYSASKSALKAYTEALQYELKGEAYVALVMPGFARTEIFRLQNTDIDESKLFVMMSMPADKMINKIYRGILKQKSRMIYGKDAHLMNAFYRLCPRLSMRVIKWVLRRARVKLFEDVFE